jgi:hypothetical protein
MGDQGVCDMGQVSFFGTGLTGSSGFFSFSLPGRKSENPINPVDPV